MNSDQLQTALHNSLSTIGGSLVALGAVTASKETAYLNIVTAAIGIVLMLIAQVQAYRANTVQAVAVSAALNAAAPAHPTTPQTVPLVIPATAPVAPVRPPAAQ